MTYKRLTDLVADCWEKPWTDLSVEQQWAWFATTLSAFLRSEPIKMPEGQPVPDDGSWDMNTVKVRKRIALEYDAKHDPVQKILGWHDMSMHASMWLKRASVKPDEAAMLLCRIDPLERDWQGNAPDPERIYVEDDKASPDRYRLLLRTFLDVAETDPKPRTLLDWRDVARCEGLRYHQWIDEYMQARIEVLPADSGSEDDAVRGVTGGTATNNRTEARIAAIVKAARQFGYDPLLVPYGGKSAIERECLDKLAADPCRFTADTFKSAWQAARKAGRIDVENVEIYRGQ